MLRISYSDIAGEQRWSLYGRLAGPWVAEMRDCWRLIRDRAPLAPSVVDLTHVTFVDKDGETLLAEMLTGGTALVAAGVENKYLIESLKNDGGAK